MTLRLTAADICRFSEAADVLAMPGEHTTLDAWRATAATAVRALFAADRLLWLMPPCRAGAARSSASGGRTPRSLRRSASPRTRRGTIWSA